MFEQPIRRVGVLSVHSSPLAPPGVGDSGGMNVTVRALAGELARAGIESDLYTRATSPDDPPVVEVEPGVRVLHLPAGPLEPIPKQHLPRYLCAFLCSLLRAGERHGPYDVLHSHYWVSWWVARLARERWDSPVVHSFHTLGRVKNLSLADGDRPASPARSGWWPPPTACSPPPRPRPASWSSCTGPPRPRSGSCPTGSTGAGSSPATGTRPGPPWAWPTARCWCSWAGSSRSRPRTWPSSPWPPCAAAAPTWTSSCWWSAGPRATATASRPGWPGWPPPTGSPTGSGSSPPAPTTAWPPSTGRPTWS